MIIKKSIIALFIFLVPFCLFAQSETFSEYEVKAAFLEKFTRFIEWPYEEHIEDVNKPFVLGVIGENPFKSILEKMYSQQKIKNKKVEIRYISTLYEIDGCNLLFISQSEKYRINRILSYTEKKPILTICDEKEFSKKGVLITQFVESNYVRFEINKNALQKAGLFVSSLLLNLSKDINTAEN
ncbi:MAG: YfiR family protein [bacterium]